MKHLCRCIVVVFVAVLSLSLSEAQTVQTYQVGAASNFATGINDNGQVVGWRSDEDTIPIRFHSWFLSNSNLSVVDFPAPCPPCSPLTDSSQANGINNLAQIVGNYTDPNGAEHGYLDNNGAFTSIDYPGAVYTVAQGINDSGTIVGWYQDVSGNFHAFEKTGSTFTTLGPPGSSWSFAYGINKQGRIVGRYRGGDCNFEDCGFLLDSGVYTQLVPPGTEEFLGYAYATGINSVGIVSGFYSFTGSGGPEDGFTFNRANGTYTIIDFPGETGSTEIWGINKKSAYVGVGFTAFKAYIVRP